MTLPELPPADQLFGHLASTHGHASAEAVARATNVLRQILACGVKSNLLAVLLAQRAISEEHAEALRTEARKTARVVPYEPPLHALRLTSEEDKRVAQMAVQNHLIPSVAHADALTVQQKVRALGLPVLLCDVLCDRAHLPAPVFETLVEQYRALQPVEPGEALRSPSICTADHLFFAQLAIANRVASPSQITSALDLQRRIAHETGLRLHVGEVLFAQEALNRTAIDTLCSLVQTKQNLPRRLHLRMPEFERSSDAALEQALHGAGGLSAADVNEALALRERLRSLGLARSIGDVVVWRGWMKEEQVEALEAGGAGKRNLPMPPPGHGPAPKKRPTVGGVPSPEVGGPGQQSPPVSLPGPRVPSWIAPLVLTAAALVAIVVIGRAVLDSQTSSEPAIVRPPTPSVPNRPPPPSAAEVESAQRRVQEFLVKADFAGAWAEQKALVDRLWPGVTRSAEEDRLSELGEQLRAFNILVEFIQQGAASPKTVSLGGDDYRILGASKSSVSLEGSGENRRSLDWSRLPATDLCTLFDAYAVASKEPLGVAVYAVAQRCDGTARKALGQALAIPGGAVRAASLYTRLTGLRVGPNDLAVIQGECTTKAEAAARVSAAAESRDRLDRIAREKEKAEKARKAAEEAAAKASAGERASLEAERATFGDLLADIEKYIHTFDYDMALSQGDKVAKRLQAADLKAQIEDRLAVVREYAGLLARLRKDINAGTLRDPVVTFGRTNEGKGKLTEATAKDYAIAIPGGQARMKWRDLRPVQLLEMFRRMDLSPADHFALGSWCLEADLPNDANTSFVAALRDSSKKRAIDEAMARYYGINVPEGGFVLFLGRLVTPTEKQNVEAGLVFYSGQWVTPEDKKMLEKGFRKFGNKWAKDEAELVAAGYLKYKNLWYTSEELDALRSTWDEAWEYETTHYKIRCNLPDSFGKQLCVLLEQAYLAYAKHFGKEPPAVKMNMLAFRTFEDYRRYCIETKAEAYLQALGFANPATNVCCGYKKFGTDDMIGTMVHEGAHLFHDRAYNGISPSWYHEGHATYFEGFIWDGTTLTFNWRPGNRIYWLKEAHRKDRLIPMMDIMKGDALSSINKGVDESSLFYSESWALYTFFTETTDPEIAPKWAALRSNFDTGRGGDFSGEAALKMVTDVFGADLTGVEAKWREWVGGLK